MSPTAKAANRLTEAVGRSGLKALTIHRHLLGRKDDEDAKEEEEGTDDSDADDHSDDDGDGDGDGDGDRAPAARSRWAFFHDEENPLKADAVIVDEASMLDTWLFNALLRALPDGCRLLMIGDADQLPSIGAGQVLADVLRCGVVPSVRLTKVYRQQRGKDDDADGGGTSIVDQAYAILSGRPNRHGFLRPLLSEHASALLDENDDDGGTAVGGNDDGGGGGGGGEDGFARLELEADDGGWGDADGGAPPPPAAAALAASDATDGTRGHCVFFDTPPDPAAVQHVMNNELLPFVRRCGFDTGSDMQPVERSSNAPNI